MLDAIDEIVVQLASERRKSLPIDDVWPLSELILEILGWSSTAYTDNPFGVAPSVLTKFVKLRGPIETRTARLVADRVRGYLKAQEPNASLHKPKRARAVTVARSEGSIEFRGISWVSIPRRAETRAKIAAVSALLDAIVEQASRSNLPPDEQALTAIERTQLIAILETALSVLKSPIAEKGLFQKARTILKKGAEAAAEKGVQTGLGKLMETAATKIAEVLISIFG